MSELSRWGKTECERNAVSRFLTWVGEKYGGQLAAYNDRDQLHPLTLLTGKTSNELVAEWLEIDLARLERERQQLLKNLAERGNA